MRKLCRSQLKRLLASMANAIQTVKWAILCVQATAGACGAVLLTDAGGLGAGGLAGPLRAAAAAALQGVPRPILVLLADAPAEALTDNAAANGLSHDSAAERASGRALAQDLHSSGGYGSIGSGDTFAPAIRVVGIAGQAGLSEPALLQGLAWLAQQAPPQPCLWVELCLPRPNCPRAMPLDKSPFAPPNLQHLQPAALSQHVCAIHWRRLRCTC